MIRLRDYQQAAHDAVFREWNDVNSTLVVIPTAGGKTILFASIIKSMQPKRALVLAERQELIWQARNKIEKVTGLNCGIEMGELYVNGSLFGEQPVIISTVQTQNSAWGDRKRMGRFNPKEFGVLVIDECHHSTASSYRSVIDYYTQNNPDIKIIGVSATPSRHDQEALGQIFQTVAFDYEISDAISDGWLVPPSQHFVNTSIDYSGIRTTAGDLNGADLAAVMEAERAMQEVTGATLEIIQDKRALVFTSSVKQAEQGSEIFNRHKIGSAAWVCGATNPDDRRNILERFNGGDIQVVFNAAVLIEGYDNPTIDYIVMAKPTKSETRYKQMIGRGLRPLDGVVDPHPTTELRIKAIADSSKPICTILDFAGNSGKHKLVSLPDILGGKVSEEAIARTIARAKKEGGAIRIDTALSEEEEKLRQEAEDNKKAAEARRAGVIAKVRFSSTQINPFDAFDIQPVKSRGWDTGHHLSEKQSALLMKQGISPDSLSYAEGRQVLNEMFRRWNGKLCTLKQAALLKKHGYETKNLTMDRASELITALRNNGWRRPATPQPVTVDNTEVPF